MGDLVTRVDQGNTKEVTLITGLRLLIRKASGVDRDLWTSKSNRHLMLTALLNGIVLDVIDPGIYAEAVYQQDLGRGAAKVFDGKKLDWRHVLRGDRMDLLMQFRAFSCGEVYEFPWFDPVCRRNQKPELAVDILHDFARQDLKDEDRQAFVAGNRFEVRLQECGRVAHYKIETGADEERLLRMVADGQIDEQSETKPLRLQVLDIEGVQANDLLRYIQREMPSDDQDQLLDEMDSHDCGYNTQVLRQCTNCRRDLVVTPPFLDRAFMIPQTALRMRRMAALQGKADGG